MRECDLVMKGGITSGMVYPHAVVEIARAYRLRSIGGTSAGAIAAALAAAAEYRRQQSPGKDDFAGYTAITEIATEIDSDMAPLFQPAPGLGRPFDILMAAVGAKGGCKLLAAAKAAIRAYGRTCPSLAALGLGAVLLVASVLQSDLSLTALGLLVAIPGALLLAAISAGIGLWCDIRKLTARDFGLCPGVTQPGAQGKPALTDWLADHIDKVAGNLPDGALGDPLTVGQLEDHGIEIAAMTTDLSSGRPYQLPMKNRLHYFSKREFEALFPARVVEYLVRNRRPLGNIGPQLPDDLYPLASGPDFPVLLVARMSLSFPGLISAVPLYRHDYLRPEEGTDRIRRCLFSDGGISSNFPIHFFASFLPTRPTFGITLVDWDKARHGDTRAALPGHRRQSTHLAVEPITGIGGFLAAILGTAKDWQDNLQSLLPGYADRIVEIRLDKTREGGMNLAMSKQTIEELVGYGKQAGALLVDQFDFDEHRWLRAISLLPKLEGALTDMAAAHDTKPAGGGLDYGELLRNHEPHSYEPTQEWREQVLVPFAAALAEIGTQAARAHAASGFRSVRNGKKIPNADSHLRLIASADRTPARGPDTQV